MTKGEKEQIIANNQAQLQEWITHEINYIALDKTLAAISLAEKYGQDYDHAAIRLIGIRNRVLITLDEIKRACPVVTQDKPE